MAFEEINAAHPEVLELVKEITDKINGVNNTAKGMKRSIYREYAEKFAAVMPSMMVCDYMRDIFPKEAELIRTCLDNKFKDLNRIEAQSHRTKYSSFDYKRQSNDANNVTEQQQKPKDPLVESDGRVLELKDENEGLHEQIDRIKEQSKQAIAELEKPFLLKIEDKYLDKIKNQGHRYLLVKDGFIWGSWDHSPSPKEWKQATEDVGF